MSPERRITFAPHGRTGCVTPSDWGASTWPQVVRWASPVAPREPAKAMFQPAGAGALVSAAAPSSESRCSTIAAAATADRSATAARRTRRWPRAAGTRVVWLRPRLRRASRRRAGCRARGAARRSRRRSARQRVRSARHLREGDHLADVRLARHERDEALDPHREAAVRRRAHRQRVEEESELLARLLVASSPSSGRRRCCTSGRWIRIEPEPSSQPFQMRS